VAERDRTPVDVDLLRVDPELPGGNDADGGERLVELEQAEIADAESGALERLEDGA
jgi:hypothetical protein